MSAELQIGTVDESDIPAILRLFAANTLSRMSVDEAMQFGFLTVPYSTDLLQRIIQLERPIKAEVDGRLVGYLIPHPVCFRSIPEFRCMIELEDALIYEGRPVADYHYIRVGQVLVDKDFRGRGVYKALYAEMKRRFKAEYEVVFTRVSKYNPMSHLVHQRLGFLPLADCSIPCPLDSHEHCERRLIAKTADDEPCRREWTALYYAWRSEEEL
jgi:GNAT superfamily N-acetyltransferase